MPEAAADLPKRRPGRFQFSLRGLLVVTLGVAVGASALTVPKASWTDPVLAAATTWIILGLINQARDLRRTYRGRTDLTTEERFGWRFAASWRLAVALMLVGLGAVNYAYRREALALPETDLEALVFWGGGLGRDVLFCFLLLIVLWSVPHGKRSPRRRGSRPLVTLFAVPAAALLCLLAWSDKATIVLVHVEVTGIEHSHPSKFALADVDFDTQAREFRFFWSSLAAVGSLALSCVALSLLARQWKRGVTRRVLWGGMLSLALGATAWYPIWVYTGGLRSASPWMPEGIVSAPLPWCATAAVLVLVFVTAATYRFVCHSLETSLRTDLNWRRNPPSYYHERIAVLVLVGAVFGYAISKTWIDTFVPTGFGWLVVGCILIWPLTTFWFLMAALAIHRIWEVWRRKSTLQPAGVPRLASGHFFAVWLGTLATVLVAIPTIAWFSFAVWLSPWYMIRWP